ETFAQPRGNETHNALMPVRRGGDEHRWTLAVPDLGLGGSHGLLAGRALNALPLAVERVQLSGDGEGLVLIVGRQQTRAERGIADSASGIDAWPEQEAEMIRVGRPVDPS